MRQTTLRTWGRLATLLIGLGLLAGGRASADQPTSEAAKEEKKDTKVSHSAITVAPLEQHLPRNMFFVEKALKDLEQYDPEQAAQLRRILKQAQQQIAQAQQQIAQAQQQIAQAQQQIAQARHAQMLAELQIHKAKQQAMEAAGRLFRQFASAGRWPVRLGIWPLPPDPVLRDQLNLPEGQGLVVADVLPGTPAAKAGLKKHDILLELQGKPVPSNPEEFREQLSKIQPGTKVDLVILRKGKREKITGVLLGGGSDQPGQPPRREAQKQEKQSSRPGWDGQDHWRRFPLLLGISLPVS